MPSTCEFELNHPNAVYYSGETVSGTIILKTTNAKNVRDMRIIFRGEGKVSWNETERQRKSDGTYANNTVHFRSNEVYVDNTTNICGEATLPAGTHTFTFQILLPWQCPSSCKGQYGSIRYELSLKLRRPFRFDNTFTKELTVIKTQDLNLNPIYRVPIVNEDIFVGCCCSCSSGNISSTLTVPFGGYAIGQNLRYSLHIQNRSMDDIYGYTIGFYRKTFFTARIPYHKTREEKSSLYKQFFDKSCLRLTTRIFEGNFLIDPTPPSTEGEAIITVSYDLKVTVHIAGCNSDKNISVPVFIGTVALRESLLPSDTQENDHLIVVTPTAPEIPMDDQIGNDLPPSYKELGPPSFEEATRSS